MSGTGARLLEDHPSARDSFGPHNRVAQGIAHLVDVSDGGKTIAIQGGWGSGKSTVIKLLAERYLKSDTLVFVYDAWVHVGDPLRRAFLSSLIRALTEVTWLMPGKHWENEQEKLAGRRKETTKHTIPQLTSFAKFLGLALLLVPVGLSLISEGIKRALSADATGSTLLISIGSSLSLLPAFGLGIWMIASAFKSKSTDETFAFFLNRTLTNESTITTETGAATSIDFQRVFAEAVGEALDNQYPKRKLIVVIDNLDRLEDEAAKEVWALLRSFLDMPQHQRAGWSKRVWVVVPIAADINELSGEEISDAVASEGFLAKIFQARFELPPPVLKNWRPFLKDAIERAFPNVERDEKRQILDLYFSMLVPGRLLTPRELISFVNNLVALASQWGDRMALGALAAYLLDTKSLGGLVGVALQGGRIPSEKVGRVLERSLREEFAMIFFNTGDSSEALDLLQRPQAEEILTSGDGAKLLSAVLKEGSFALVANRVLDDVQSWAQFDIARVFMAISAVLDAAQVCVDTGQTPPSDDLADLISRAEKLAEWTINFLPAAPLATPSFIRLADAVLRTGNHSFIEAMVKALSRPTPGDAQPQYFVPSQEDVLAGWLKGCVCLAERTEIRDEVLRSGRSLFPNLSAQQYLLVLNEIDDSGTFDALSKTSLQEPLALLQERVRVRGLKEYSRDMVRWCTARSPREELSKLAPDLEQALQGQDSIPLFVLGAVEIFCELRDVSTIRSTFERLVATGVMHHHLWASQAVPEAAGAIAWCILFVRPSGVPDQAFGNSPNAMSLVNLLLAGTAAEAGSLSKAMLDFCERMKVTTEWMRASLQYPHLANLLRTFCADPHVIHDYVMTLEASEYRLGVDDLAIKLGRDIQSSQEVAARFGDEKFCEDLVGQLSSPDDAWLMTLALSNLPQDLVRDVVVAALQMLRAMDEEAWISRLGVRPDLVRLVRVLTDKGIGVDLGVGAKSALRSLLSKFKLARTVDAGEATTFESLRAALAPDERMSLDDQAYEDVTSASVQFGEAWNVLEPVVKEGLARNGATLRIGRRLLLPTLQNEDLLGIACLTRIFSEEAALKTLKEDQVAIKDVREVIDGFALRSPMNSELVTVAAGLLQLVT